MVTIWKFAIPFARRFEIDMPRGARPLCVQMQETTPTLWATVDPAQPLERHAFAIYGTGWEMPDDLGPYIGTYQSGAFVWHVFDMGGYTDSGLPNL